ncbi:ShlB/FhaC/HecB family hemolysin secretion/activation protein [Waterburya agarophytonicola K14]|uniref:ShlB/FhaC/HecB family hemolysin secretion/activation protein n=1 Tax=Waterburya agarophytonicola KI4 TaxID=2874699 RepID=A0A964BS14_9CYAN|nr:ShlB/FhaC/HecB family hemolysin secretion/activation protein [Waterburya agarophytonicola]MCC0177137.1 ShlB/FhaC/HecB family hemolysin secretion/activation protein [Waterburya agarophytonicola KI4]
MKKAINFESSRYLLAFASTLGLISYSNCQLQAIAAEKKVAVETGGITNSGKTDISQGVLLNKRENKVLISQVNQKPTPPPQPLPAETNSPRRTRDRATVRSEDDIDVPIQTVRVKGDTILTQAEVDGIAKPLEGKTVTLAELRLAIDDLTQIYLERGYITSRAVLDESSLDSGNIQIQIVEGSVKRIDVKGTKRLENYVRDRVNLAAGTPLNSAKLEDSLRLLRLDPLFANVEASISAGDNPEVGQSVVEVRVTESDRFNAKVSIDNYSPPSVGGERLGLKADYRSLFRGGDTITASFYPRFSALTDTFDFGLEYQIPVNARNGTVTTGININRNEVINPIGEELDDLEIEGESERFNLGFRQPIIQNPRQELALSLGFDYQDGQTLLFQSGFPFGLGSDENGETTTSVLRFGQEYIKRQVSGAWAFRSQFNLGFGAFGATENEEPIPDGQFISWLGQMQRVQVLNSDNFLVIQADIQLTPDGLLPSQQFVIGGGQSVRGYRQNVRSGDNGLVISVEDRWALFKNQAGETTFTFTPFFNLGTVWNQGDNPNPLPDQTFIAALGVGFIWEPINGLNLRLNYAPPLVSLDDKGDNIQDDGLHFSLDYGFSF